jgi:beta-lactamase regulating signal transducer with metallopeptidase domain
MNALAWSLIHFLWQGAAIAAVAGALMYAFRAPATRYLIGIGSLALMLITFAVTFTLLSGAFEPELPAARAPAAALASPLEAPADSMTLWVEPQAAADFPFAWLAQGWLAGVLLLALRIVFGLVLIEQLRRRNLIALPDVVVARFRALQARLGIQRDIRYHQCDLVGVPAVIGFFRPIVLLPVRALTGLSPEQLEAVVAHELGHIQRCDVLVNFFQVVAETLFFFHPAVWWLNKRIRADREDCCDDIALTTGGNKLGYAKALAMIAEWRAVPQFAMAATGGPVAARIARLLGVNRADPGARTAGMFTASLVLAGALVTGAVSVGWVNPAEAQTPAADAALPAPAAKAAEAALAASPAPAPPAAPAPLAPKPAKPAKPAQAATPATTATPAVSPQPRVRNRVDTEVQTSFIDEMASVGIVDVDLDTLVALKVHNVTPELIREIRVSVPDIQVQQIIPFAVHGVTPSFVQQARAINPVVDADGILAMRIHDVSPAYVKSLRDLGLKLDADDAIAMKVHGITPEYVRELRAAGFDVDTQDVIAMKIHGVTADYRQMLESAGFKSDTDQIIQARVMGITPEFVQKVRSHGFQDLKLQQLIALKNADVL